MLQELLALACASHPAIRAQRAQQQVAALGVEQARAQYWPTPALQLESGHKWLPAGGGERSQQAVVSLQQPLWTGGRLGAELDMARAGVAASDAAFEQTRQQVALRVVQTYGEWLAAYQKWRAYDASMASHQRLSEQVRRRVTQGLAAASDEALAQTRLQGISADLATSEAQQEVALARLAQLLGQPLDAGRLRAAPDQARALEGDLDTLLAQALAADPGVARAQAQVAQAQAAIAERRAALAPEVYVRVERQFGSADGASPAAQNRVVLGLRSRWGAGTSTLDAVASAQAQRAAAEEEVAVQQRQVSEQVLADYVLARSSGTRLAALAVSSEAAAQVADSYIRQFLAGKRSWLDVMNAAREQAQIEVQQADVRAALLVASWRLALLTRAVALTGGV